MSSQPHQGRVSLLDVVCTCLVVVLVTVVAEAVVVAVLVAVWVAGVAVVVSVTVVVLGDCVTVVVVVSVAVVVVVVAVVTCAEYLAAGAFATSAIGPRAWCEAANATSTDAPNEHAASAHSAVATAALEVRHRAADLAAVAVIVCSRPSPPPFVRRVGAPRTWFYPDRSRRTR
jgi:hypothetical protein